MKARPAILLAISIAIAACADETTGPEPAEFADLCGQEGPVQILALDPDRPLAWVADQGVFGDRRVLRIWYAGDEPLIDDAYPATGDRELWSVGPCGEDPLLLVEGDHHAVTYSDVWPDVLLECDEASGRISTLDPAGIRPANVVFETSDCSARTIDDGLLTIVPHDDEQTGSLVLQSWPDDPWTMQAEPVMLLDSIRMPTYFAAGDVGVTDEEILVVTGDDELVAVSRLDGETTTIATDVHEFANDSAGRYVIWQDTELTNGDPDWPEGPIFLLDRQTSAVTQLAETRLGDTILHPFALEAMNILQLRLESSGVTRFYRLPTLESIEVPVDLTVYRAVDETRALVGAYFFGGPYWLVDTLTGELTSLFDGTGGMSWGDEFMLVLENVECCIADNGNRKPGKLWRVPYDGERELLARRATNGYRFTTDGRVITPIDVGTDWLGTLVVVDPATLDEQVIDDHVLRFQPSAFDEIDGDPIVLYGVGDPERQGVWLARLAD
jgi:hypothetical protein